jgi:hypothetical protein
MADRRLRRRARARISDITHAPLGARFHFNAIVFPAFGAASLYVCGRRRFDSPFVIAAAAVEGAAHPPARQHPFDADK